MTGIDLTTASIASFKPLFALTSFKGLTIREIRTILNMDSFEVLIQDESINSKRQNITMKKSAKSDVFRMYEFLPQKRKPFAMIFKTASIVKAIVKEASIKSIQYTVGELGLSFGDWKHKRIEATMIISNMIF